MNGRPLTDARISQALRAHLPARAEAGLRERILEAAETTTQQRALPSFFGALSAADTVTRRRSLLLVAALLIALALASAAAVGALRLLERDPIHELSLEPPADLPAFVLSSYERLPQLPPVAFAWHDSGSAKGRIYVDRSGAIRFDRFTSAEATEPSSYTILSDHRISGMALVESHSVWVEQGDEAVGEDPRLYLLTILSAGRNAADGPGCEMERDPSEVGNGTAATGWRYVGVEYVAGRPTHHVACVGLLSLDTDLWLDIETRLILRMREPLIDEAGQPIPGQFGTTEVTEIAFGEQPAALFEPPEGVTRMSSEAYNAYLCTRDLPNEEVVGLGARSECAPPPDAEATPLPTSTPLPTVRPSVRPRPSGPAGPLAWSEASLKEDWPAPVRSEPAGGATVVPLVDRYEDPTGDTESDAFPWVDIHAVSTGRSGSVRVSVPRPPHVDPTEQWIAYGLVVDDDGDGVADRRIGIDNIPGPAADWWRHRVWITDLHTGQTVSVVETTDTDSVVGDTFLDSNLPVCPATSPECLKSANFGFGAGDIAGGGSFDGTPTLFYAWASVIVDGRVMATDYAPDAGWLHPS